MQAAFTAARPAALTRPTGQRRHARSVTVAAATQEPAQWPAPVPAAAGCPLECAAAVQEKSSCVHPGRPVANACPDCPRRGAIARMAKSK